MYWNLQLLFLPDLSESGTFISVLLALGSMLIFELYRNQKNSNFRNSSFLSFSAVNEVGISYYSDPENTEVKDSLMTPTSEIVSEKVHSKVNTIALSNTELSEKKELFFKAFPDFIKNLTSHVHDLSPKELEHAVYIVLKLKARTVAKKSFTSTRTVENFRYKIKKKLNLPRGKKLRDFLFVLLN